MESTQYVPVELANIERGDYLENCGKKFDEIQHEFVTHVEENKGSSKAKLVMEIELNFNDKLKAFSIATSVEKKMPKEPRQVTTAFLGADEETGEQGLFTQSAGTQKGNPKQGILSDTEGQHVT